MGRRSSSGEAFLHEYHSLVECRNVLPKELRNAEPDGIVEQYPLRSHRAEVSFVSLLHVVTHTQNPKLFRLPGLVDELQSMLKQTELRLHKLPKPPSDNPVGEIIEMVSSFSRSLSAFVDGTPDERGIHQTIRPLHMKFRGAIKDAAPDFRPYKSGERMQYEPPTFLAAEKPELGSDDGAIYVDQVMNTALQ